MAFQTSSSSPPPAQTTAASPPPGGGPGDGQRDGQLSTRNSIPFSFLVAFLAIFAVFMAMGLWARRIVFFVRRQLGLPLPEPPRRHHHAARPKKPVLWDVIPDGPVQEKNITGTQPLSLWYCRPPPPPMPEAGCSPTTPPPQSRGHLPPSLMAMPGGRGPRVPIPPVLPHDTRRAALPYRRIIENWRDAFDPMRHEKAKEVEEKTGEPDAVQVAVFIAMPSPVEKKKMEAGDEYDALPGDVSIGIAELPWRLGESQFDVHET